MNSGDRLGLATRAFLLATVLGMSVAFGEMQAVQGTLALLAIAVLALGAGRFSVLSLEYVTMVEGYLAALTIGLALPDSAVLLPYLVAPAVIAGTSPGRRSVVLIVGSEAAALILVLLLGGATAGFAEGMELAAPWALVGLGAGYLTRWVSQWRQVSIPADGASYESARRLLGQLRTVARRLSSGLDPVSMAEQILARTHAVLDDTQAALFVRTEGGVLAPLGYRGPAASQALLPDDPLVQHCWAAAEPATEARATGRSTTRHRVVMPLRSGTRMIGVVVSDAATAPEAAVLRSYLQELDEQALRLDTALVFDEVRSLATLEERQRLAREIHDGVAQEVASLGYVVDELAADALTDAHRARLRDLRGEITRVVSELRLSIFDLRSEIAPAGGLGSALSDYVRAVGARSGLTVHLTLDEAPTRLRSEVETELLRIAQEAVTNARKHSAAHNLWVDCRVRPPFAEITVQDDGGGLGTARPDSYGMKIMRERAQRIAASLRIEEQIVAPGTRGTRVAVTVGGVLTPQEESA